MPTCQLTYLVCDVADLFSISKITSIVISLSYVLSIFLFRERKLHIIFRLGHRIVRDKEISLFISLVFQTINPLCLSRGTRRREAASPFFFFFSLLSSLFSNDFHVTTIPHARTRIVTHAFQGFWGCTWVERVPTFSARKRSLPKGTHARDDPAVWSLPRAPFLSRCLGWPAP